MTRPRTLGKYEILDVLGVGGMGTVYRALDPALQRIVAVKLLRREYRVALGSDDLWARFRTEARAVARLNHPAIVSVYDFLDTDPAGAFFVMEYVDGHTLDEHIRRAVKLDLGHTLELMCQLLDGLGYAHAQDIVHRDIKPSNLLVTRDGQLKITDFGVAKIGSLKQTQIGMAIGTPEYMAPEQYTSGYIDPRCDLYAAGALFFELLTGRPPFAGTSAEIMYQICHVTPEAVSTADPAIPKLLDPVLARALAKDPDDRFQSAWHFSEAITAVRKVLGLPAAPSSRRPAAAPAPVIRVAQTEESGVRGWVEETKGVRRIDPAPVPIPHPAMGSGARTVPPDGWSNEQLAEIERKLSPILGPMAKILVKRAAALTRDRGQLCQDLAAQLHTDEERKRFLSAVTASTGSGSRPTPSVTPSITPVDTVSAARHEIAPATLDRTTKILIRLIGPIAATLVKKTAPAARDESDLYTRLAERITDVKERERFLAEVRRRF